LVFLRAAEGLGLSCLRRRTAPVLSGLVSLALSITVVPTTATFASPPHSRSDHTRTSAERAPSRGSTTADAKKRSKAAATPVEADRKKPASAHNAASDAESPSADALRLSQRLPFLRGVVIRPTTPPAPIPDYPGVPPTSQRPEPETTIAAPPEAGARDLSPASDVSAPAAAAAIESADPASSQEVSAVATAAKPSPATASHDTRADRIVRSALSYRGAPYRRGAMGRSGAFDCSGFTKYLFDHEGANLPRTAADQYRRGLPVGREEMKPGDLVFFKNTYKAGISHVGIYLGDGQFIHAASTRTGVRVDSLDKPYYVNHYAGARRPQ
jgi:cell wall-associated NlpC family hydrolase